MINEHIAVADWSGGIPMEAAKLTVVVPVHNEREVLDNFYRRLSRALDRLTIESEILFVDDGSRDESLAILRGLRARDERVGIIALSRNFGKEAALSAGLDAAEGEAVVVMDADLQDPPELIPELVAQWRNGYDVVYAKRTARDGDSALKVITAHAFYRLMQHIGQVPIPRDTGDFRLLSRRAVDALKRLPERHRFMKGLFTWIGYPQCAVPYRREPRDAGQTKWNYWKLWNFALEGITSFTTAPLKVATYLGIAVSALAFLYAAILIIGTMLHGNPVHGYPSLMVVMLMLGGVQLVCLGVMGEYLGRMFDETKHRPLYLVDVEEPARSRQRDAGRAAAA